MNYSFKFPHLKKGMTRQKQEELLHKLLALEPQLLFTDEYNSIADHAIEYKYTDIAIYCFSQLPYATDDFEPQRLFDSLMKEPNAAQLIKDHPCPEKYNNKLAIYYYKNNCFKEDFEKFILPSFKKINIFEYLIYYEEASLFKRFLEIYPKEVFASEAVAKYTRESFAKLPEVLQSQQHIIDKRIYYDIYIEQYNLSQLIDKAPTKKPSKI